MLMLLGRRIARKGFRTVLFSYPSVRCSVEENTERLQRLLQSFPDEEIHFLGHSLGGLIILRFFATYPEQKPGRIVALGVPFQGSWVAARITRLPGGRRFLGQAAGLLVRGYDRAPPGRELGVIAGTRPIGIGRLFSGMPVPSDGAVLVRETELPQALAHVNMPVTHSTMVFAPEVAEQAATFLRYGQFRPPGE